MSKSLFFVSALLCVSAVNANTVTFYGATDTTCAAATVAPNSLTVTGQSNSASGVTQTVGCVASGANSYQVTCQSGSFSGIAVNGWTVNYYTGAMDCTGTVADTAVSTAGNDCQGLKSASTGTAVNYIKVACNSASALQATSAMIVAAMGVVGAVLSMAL